MHSTRTFSINQRSRTLAVFDVVRENMRKPQNPYNIMYVQYEPIFVIEYVRLTERVGLPK